MRLVFLSAMLLVASTVNAQEFYALGGVAAGDETVNVAIGGGTMFGSIGLEAAYLRERGPKEVDGQNSGTNFAGGTGSSDATRVRSFHGVRLALVGTAPIGQGFSLAGSIARDFMKALDSGPDKARTAIGAGVQYMPQDFGIRMMLERAEETRLVAHLIKRF